MSKNCLLLAPPLCGARVLAGHLVDSGYSAGKKCLASRLDPSLSSFEDEQTVYLNAKLFAPHKAQNLWNQDPQDNPFSFFLDMQVPGFAWPKAVADPVILSLRTDVPWVRKDPQFIFTCRYWKSIWSKWPDMPQIVMLNRFPLDWIAAVMSHCDDGVWPHIPKDISYLSGLWVDYTEHMMAILRNPEAKDAIVLTLDHLCLPEWQKKLSGKLQLQTDLMPGFDVTKMRHVIRRDMQRMDPQLKVLWDRWQWLVLRSHGSGLHPWDDRGVINRVTC